MERNDVQSFIKRLQDLDKRIDDESDPDELLRELNNIVEEISTDVELDITRKSISTTLKFINKSSNPDPDFATEGSSGFDLRANLSKDQIINEHSVVSIPTGIYVEVDPGLEVQIRSRSGLADNANLFVLNSPGTVDSDYRGEIKIILANFSDTPRTIKNGERIAQAVVCPVYGAGRLNMVKVDNLSETKRNSGGFGHTGKT